ncbi:MAG: hypothetical protein RIR11_3420 [Bacteroidota bacterium]
MVSSRFNVSNVIKSNSIVVMSALVLVIGIGLCSQTNGSSSPEVSWKKDSTAYTLREKARLLYDAEVYDSSLLYAYAAAERGEKLQDWHTWGEAQTYIMAAQYYLGQTAEAAAGFPKLEQKALTVIPVDSAFWTDYFNTAAAIYNDLGNYEAAIAVGRKEIDYYEKTNNVASLSLARNNVGGYYLNRGDYDRALEYTLAALQGYSTITEADEDQVWTNAKLSEIYFRKTDYPKAIHHAEIGLSMLKTKCPENAELEANLNLSLGSVYAFLKEHQKSLSYLQKALQIQKKNDIEQNLENILISLGFAYTQIGRYPLALQYLQSALDVVKPNSPNYARVCRYLGTLQQASGYLRSALEWKQKALITLSGVHSCKDSLDNPPISTNGYIDFFKTLAEKATILQLLAQKESKPALLEAAHSSLDLATVVLDSMRTIYQEGSKQFWNEEARPMLENAIDLALQLHQSTGNEIYLTKAFAYAEKGKAYLLSESLRESAARQKAGIPQGVIQEEKQIKIDIAFYHKQIFEAQQLKNTDNTKIPLWQSEILRLHRNQEDLLARMEKDFPEYYQIKYKQQISSIQDLQRKLPENTGLLEFFQGDNAIYAFYLDRQQAYARRCVPDSSLTHLLRDLRNQDTVLSRGRGPVAVQTFVRDAHSLYQNLVAAVVPQIPTNLIIIPDGQLAYLPFDLLVTENVDKKDQPKFVTLPYLLRKTTIRYEYSAFLAFQPVGNNHAEYFFDGYAPDYNPKLPEASGRDGKNGCLAWQTTDFARLANNQQEVEAIAQITAGNALLGSAATEAGFRKNSQKPRILHLAMHGFLNDCDPAYSGLVFSPSAEQDSVQEDNDGILHAFEIYNLHLNAELAVLSACNTGRGKMAKGEGVISLARAFKYAGCPNILMSLWQADDKATASIMTHFYEHLSRGLGKAEAIRQAKLDYLSGSAQNHPFFWAAFVLIGGNEPLEAAVPWLWYGVLGLGMLLLGLFLWQKMHIK